MLPMVRIEILATSDLHNRLQDAAADSIQRVRAASPASLLLDAGDAVRAGNLGFSPLGEPILRRMTALGYECMAVGNREFHPRGGIFRRKVVDAGFPLVCANVFRRSPESKAFLPSGSAIVSVGGARVGVVGILTPMVTEAMLLSFASDYIFADPLDAASGEIDRIKDEVEFVVCLCHARRDVARELATRVDGVGAVFLGHVHGHGDRVEHKGGVPIISPMPYGAEMGRLCLGIGGGGARVDLAETVRIT
jgi:2',3'-cyclic-nucleotide 2'-phosphodiesterase (5'-nucleotidase family)